MTNDMAEFVASFFRLVLSHNHLEENNDTLKDQIISIILGRSQKLSFSMVIYLSLNVCCLLCMGLIDYGALTKLVRYETEAVLTGFLKVKSRTVGVS